MTRNPHQQDTSDGVSKYRAIKSRFVFSLITSFNTVVYLVWYSIPVYSITELYEYISEGKRMHFIDQMMSTTYHKTAAVCCFKKI